MLELIAAILLVLGSYLVLRTVYEAEAWDARAPGSTEEREDDIPYRPAA